MDTKCQLIASAKRRATKRASKSKPESDMSSKNHGQCEIQCVVGHCLVVEVIRGVSPNDQDVPTSLDVLLKRGVGKKNN